MLPAAELRNSRVPLTELGFAGMHDRSLVELATALASDDPTQRDGALVAARSCATITDRLGTGAAVTDVAREVGWSTRTLQRQCAAVYGYGPRHFGASCDSAARSGCWTTEHRRRVSLGAGYADQPHLHREIRGLTGMSLTTLRQDNAQKRSTDVPSGSVTVA